MAAAGESGRGHFFGRLHAGLENSTHQLFELIDSAQRRLFLHTFILSDDELGEKLIQRLCEKSRAGVVLAARCYIATNPSVSAKELWHGDCNFGAQAPDRVNRLPARRFSNGQLAGNPPHWFLSDL